jgi:hypothetical protein
MIARPCARRCRDRERENLSPLALGDHARMVRVEIEMAVEIDEAAHWGEPPGSDRNRSKSPARSP